MAAPSGKPFDHVGADPELRTSDRGSADVQAHAQERLRLEPERLVEPPDCSICRSYLEVDLDAAHGSQRVNGMANEVRADTAPPAFGRHRDRIQPSPMSVVSRHHGADDAFGILSHEEQVVSHHELCVEHRRRRVVRLIVREHAFPQRDDSGAVTRNRGANVQWFVPR